MVFVLLPKLCFEGNFIKMYGEGRKYRFNENGNYRYCHSRHNYGRNAYGGSKYGERGHYERSMNVFYRNGSYKSESVVYRGFISMGDINARDVGRNYGDEDLIALFDGNGDALSGGSLIYKTLKESYS